MKRGEVRDSPLCFLCCLFACRSSSGVFTQEAQEERKKNFIQRAMDAAGRINKERNREIDTSKDR